MSLDWSFLVDSKWSISPGSNNSRALLTKEEVLFVKHTLFQLLLYVMRFKSPVNLRNNQFIMFNDSEKFDLVEDYGKIYKNKINELSGITIWQSPKRETHI